MVKWAMFNSIQTSWNLKQMNTNNNNQPLYDEYKQYMNPLFDISKSYIISRR